MDVGNEALRREYVLSKQGGRWQWTALHWAVYFDLHFAKGSFNLVKMLKSCFQSSSNLWNEMVICPDKYGYIPLHSCFESRRFMPSYQLAQSLVPSFATHMDDLHAHRFWTEIAVQKVKLYCNLIHFGFFFL